MAQKTKTILVDDLDGSPADETVSFGLDGRFYELDLTKAHAKELRKALDSYVSRARAVAPPKPALETQKVREWAHKNGYKVSGRGRLSHSVVAAYREAKK